MIPGVGGNLAQLDDFLKGQHRGGELHSECSRLHAGIQPLCGGVLSTRPPVAMAIDLVPDKKSTGFGRKSQRGAC